LRDKTCELCGSGCKCSTQVMDALEAAMLDLELSLAYPRQGASVYLPALMAGER
jgi:hypothetical protein